MPRRSERVDQIAAAKLSVATQALAMAEKINWKRAAQFGLHPTQMEILEAAASQDRISPVQLAQGGPGLSRVAYHVRVLSEAGLLEAAGTAPRRGATEHYYRLAKALRE